LKAHTHTQRHTHRDTRAVGNPAKEDLRVTHFHFHSHSSYRLILWPPPNHVHLTAFTSLPGDRRRRCGSCRWSAGGARSAL